MSAPAEKHLPEPVSTMAATSSRSLRTSKTSTISLRSSAFWALTGGRLSVTTATRSSTVTSRVLRWSMEVSLNGVDRHVGRRVRGDERIEAHRSLPLDDEGVDVDAGQPVGMAHREFGEPA